MVRLAPLADDRQAVSADKLANKKTTMKLHIALLAFLIIGCSRSPANSVLAVTGATVIDVQDGSRDSDATILIEADRISAVGPARDISIPAGARVIDARGKYVLPGL